MPPDGTGGTVRTRDSGRKGGRCQGSVTVPLYPQGPATNTYTFVNRHAATILLVFGYETEHEAISEGQAMVFRSNREFIQIFVEQ